MPMWDRQCPECGWVKRDSYEAPGPKEVLCPEGHKSERVWLPNASRVTVIDDSWPGGRVFENLSHTPMRLFSRSELRREMAARGLEPMVRHVPVPGSDKSPNTTRWGASLSQDYMDDLAVMLKRVEEHA